MDELYTRNGTPVIAWVDKSGELHINAMGVVDPNESRSPHGESYDRGYEDGAAKAQETIDELQKKIGWIATGIAGIPVGDMTEREVYIYETLRGTDMDHYHD